MTDKNQLRLKIGQLTQHDFQAFLGDQDITDSLCIKSIRMEADSDTYRTKLTLEVYPEGLEIIPDDTVIKVYDDLRSGRLGKDSGGQWYVLPVDEVKAFYDLDRQIEKADANYCSEKWAELLKEFESRYRFYRHDGNIEDIEVIFK